MSGSDKDVVVPEDLKERAHKIIDAHRDVQSEDFQRILARIEDDLDRLGGLSKEEFVSAFHGSPAY